MLSAWGDTPQTEEQRFITEVYEKYKALMFSTAKGYVSSQADQEDVVQSALERLLRIFSEDRERSITASYIVYTVRSVSVDLLRRQGRREDRQVELTEDALDALAPEPATLEEQILPSDAGQRLMEVWPRLTEEDRLLLEGKYLFEQRDEALAALLGCKPESVRMKLTRARRRALALLVKEGGDRV